MKRMALAAWIGAMTIPVSAQDIFMTRSGVISFFSSTPLEDIEAKTESATCILRTNTGELAFTLFMKSFAFERAAMQDHFNDQFVHSDKYPKAIFEGRIQDIGSVDFSSDGKYDVTVNGELTIHGVTQPVSVSGHLAISGGNIQLSGVFTLLIADYDVKVPSNFIKNIAKEIEITVAAELSPYER